MPPSSTDISRRSGNHALTSPSSERRNAASHRGSMAGATWTLFSLSKSSFDFRARCASCESKGHGSKTPLHASASTGLFWHARQTVSTANGSQEQARR